jgi:hypothetical protein
VTRRVNSVGADLGLWFQIIQPADPAGSPLGGLESAYGVEAYDMKK